MKYFAENMTYTDPERGFSICFCAGDVTLQQKNKSKRPVFLVRYGKQVKSNLTYSDAAKELGAALMHQATCNGELRNDFE
jgi:uncharacterized lipoprotein NlpE involved in copper resistance